MRLRLVALALALGLLSAPSPAVAVPRFKAVFHASTHTPKVNAKWVWSVGVANLAGKPVTARITARIVDPYGGSHPVLLGATTTSITNYPVQGSFTDYVQFPPESQGFRLTFRLIVKGPGGRRLLTYWVKPR